MGYFRKATVDQREILARLFVCDDVAKKPSIRHTHIALVESPLPDITATLHLCFGLSPDALNYLCSNVTLYCEFSSLYPLCFPVIAFDIILALLGPIVSSTNIFTTRSEASAQDGSLWKSSQKWYNEFKIKSSLLFVPGINATHAYMPITQRPARKL